jgi:hypothetical protein
MDGYTVGMSWRRRHQLLKALIPILLFGLMLPIGVMPGHAHGTPTLVLCQAAHPAPAGRHQDASSTNDQSTPAICPFAATASAAPTAAHPIIVTDAGRSDLAPDHRDGQRVPAFGPTRNTSPRGPPTHAFG